MEIQKKIKNLIKNSLTDLNIEVEIIPIEHPTDVSMGDYSTNVAFMHARQLAKDTSLVYDRKVYTGDVVTPEGASPKVFAEKIVNIMAMSRLNLDIGIEKIEAVNGFVNLFLSREFFSDSIKEILKEKDFGKNKTFKGQKIIVEHTDPNPFKEFHVGHLMPNVIGSTVARILEWNGADVKQACYQGDVGMHVAKSVWALQKGINIKEAYVAGSKAFNEDEAVKKEIQEINKKIYQKTDSEINKIYEDGRKQSLEYFDSMYKVLGQNFDYFFFESEVAGKGKEIVEKNIGKVFEYGDGGAIVFKAENFNKNLHTRVFINGEGLPTYEAKELGLAEIKYEKYKYDRSIVITGNEINDYFKVLLCAMKQIFPELAAKTLHFSNGMLRLPSGKMSSRTGDVITATSLIDLVKEKVKGDERVAIGAIKYMILRQSVGGDIVFDIEKSVSTEGDSGVYLQYSYARANSILEKAKEGNIKPDANIPQDWVTTEVERLLYRFPEVVARAGEDFAPHYIVSYLTELARAYNSFYGNNLIVDKDDVASPYKIALSEAFSVVMKNGLTILGIEAPVKM